MGPSRPLQAPTAVSFSELMAARWSCRSFRQELVPEDELTRIFESAQRTASWCNTQPWQVHLLSGEARRSFSEELVAHASEHADPVHHSPDFALPEYSGEYLERRREAGYALYASLGIQRSDSAARRDAALANFRFFDAPHVAVISSSRSLGTYGAIDCGAYVANLMHAALERDVATIAQGAIALHAVKVRELLELPKERAVVCAVAMGRAREDHPVNAFRTSRVDLDDVLVHIRTRVTSREADWVRRS